MKIVLASPLYPPDIAPPAPYTKELAKRLAASGHEVVLVVYGRLPEPLGGARIVAIDKQLPLPLRLWRFFRALLREVSRADAAYIQNGPSVELPAAAASLFTRTPLFIRFGDEAAHRYAQRRLLRRALEGFIARRARLIQSAPGERPEILPLEERPEAALHAWEESWTQHVRELGAKLSHAA